MKKIYSKFTKERDRRFQIETAIYVTEDGKKAISKRALLPEGQEHIDNIYQNYQYFKEQGICLLTPCRMEHKAVFFDFVTGDSYYTQILQALENKDQDRLQLVLEKYKDIFETMYPAQTPFEKTESFVSVFGNIDIPSEMSAVKKLNIDLTFDNLVENGENTIILDYEWIFDFPVPVKFSIYRALFAIALKHKAALNKLMTEDELFEYFNISIEERKIFAQMNDGFMFYVEGKDYSYSRTLNQYKQEVYYFDEEMKTEPSYAQIYLDRGMGYSEENSRMFPILKEQREVELEMTLDPLHMPREIRIDPLNTSVMIRMIYMEADTTEGIRKITIEQTEQNANTCAGNDLVFKSSDPQILLRVLEGEQWTSIRIKYEILFSELKNAEPYLQLCKKREEELKEKIEEQGQLLHASAKRFVELEELLQLYKDKLNYIENTRAYRSLLKQKVEQIHLWDKLKEQDN
ncbi:hypothetical protein K040078D81_33600 [Blautia hominis]|uniref:Uncharacterized protein n=1 Tax=Blautia hominis TaxID=2025493 RepID=A0ABQ0BCP9_9FIRM